MCKLKYADICTKYAKKLHKYVNEEYAKYVHNKPKICINTYYMQIYVLYA